MAFSYIRYLNINGGSFKNTSGHNDYVLDSAFKSLVEKIEVSASYLYENGLRSPPRRCAPKTHVESLEETKSWIRCDQNDSSSLLWLSGEKGVGKSVIGRTIADWCRTEKCLLATFFIHEQGSFKNEVKDLAESFVATLVYEASLYLPDKVRICILQAIAKEPTIFSLPMEEQFQRLLVQPLSIPSQGFIEEKHPHVIIIDGLDHIVDDSVRRQLLRLFYRNPLKSQKILFLSSAKESISRFFQHPAVTQFSRIMPIGASEIPASSRDSLFSIQVEDDCMDELSLLEIESHIIGVRVGSSYDLRTRSLEELSFIYCYTGSINDQSSDPSPDQIACDVDFSPGVDSDSCIGWEYLDGSLHTQENDRDVPTNSQIDLNHHESVLSPSVKEPLFGNLIQRRFDCPPFSLLVPSGMEMSKFIHNFTNGQTSMDRSSLLRIYIGKKEISALKLKLENNRLQLDGLRDSIEITDTKSSANLILDVTGETAGFRITNLENQQEVPSEYQLQHTTRGYYEDVSHLLRGAAHFYHYLRMSKPLRDLKNGPLSVECKTVKAGIDFNTLASCYEVDSDVSKADSGWIGVETFESTRQYHELVYGFRFINKSKEDFYVWALFFNVNDFQISLWHEPDVRVDMPRCLEAGGCLDIGIGIGSAPLVFALPDNQVVDLGFLQIYATTEYVDLSHIPQASPFNSARYSRDARAEVPCKLPQTLDAGNAFHIPIVQVPPK